MYLPTIKKSLFLILLLAGAFLPASAQISLSPSFVYIDGRTGVGDLYVSNSSEKNYEITISFVFGYPSSDSTGALVMQYNDPEAYRSYALDSMIRAFPRNFILPAGEQRTVRIQLLPDKRGKEGFYFTRMKIMAKPETAEITGKVSEGVATMINFNFEQVTAVFYQKGDLATGIEVKEVNVSQADSALHLKMQLNRTGNAPFLGTIQAKLKDSKGKILSETESATSIYFGTTRSMDLRLAGVPAGNYTLELRFETRRKDIKSKNLVQAPPIVHEQKVLVR